MTETVERSNMPQIETGPLIIGGVLVGVGAMLVMAGIAVGGAHVFAATRRWVNEMETPPSELARQKWAQAKAARPRAPPPGRTGFRRARRPPDERSPD